MTAIHRASMYMYIHNTYNICTIIIISNLVSITCNERIESKVKQYIRGRHCLQCLNETNSNTGAALDGPTVAGFLG